MLNATSVGSNYISLIKYLYTYFEKYIIESLFKVKMAMARKRRIVVVIKNNWPLTESN